MIRTFSLQELADYVGGQPSLVPGPQIGGVRPLEYAGEKDITYVASPQFMVKLDSSLACAALIPIHSETSRPYIRCKNPEAAFARLTSLFYPNKKPTPGISEKADIHPSTTIGYGVHVGPYAVIGENCLIQQGSVIGAHSVIGDDCVIGEDCFIFPHVVLYPRVTLGSRVLVHSGTVLGSDGFGYARDADPDGIPFNIKKYHHGRVEIGDDVEVGALCAVDRAMSGVTVLEKGVKIDNLVQIAHNVSVGEATVIASQSGIAGSSSIGKYGLVGGQVGLKDHVHVGDGVILATRVGIYRNVPSGSVMAGSIPAMTHKVFLRVQSLFKRLPEMLDRIRKLEERLQSTTKEQK